MPIPSGPYQDDWNYKGGGVQNSGGPLGGNSPYKDDWNYRNPGGEIKGAPSQVSGGFRSVPMGGAPPQVGNAQPMGFQPQQIGGMGNAPAWLSQIPVALQPYYLQQWRANPAMSAPPLGGMQQMSMGAPPPPSQGPSLSANRNFGSNR